MAYAVYTTNAIVCGSKENNTADRAYLLFTKDAGMFYATARSVREERSKQRFALQEFSLIKVSLVRGKNGWRIGSAESEGNFFSLSDTRAKRTALSLIIKLIRQFIHGEENHPSVFSDLKTVLEKITETDESQLQNLTDIFTLRLLHRLGYIAKHESYNQFLESGDLDRLDKLPKSAYAAIDKAKNASHL